MGTYASEGDARCPAMKKQLTQKCFFTIKDITFKRAQVNPPVLPRITQDNRP
jgi:hypothetical protein